MGPKESVFSFQSLVYLSLSNSMVVATRAANAPEQLMCLEPSHSPKPFKRPLISLIGVWFRCFGNGCLRVYLPRPRPWRGSAQLMGVSPTPSTFALTGLIPKH